MIAIFGDKTWGVTYDLLYTKYQSTLLNLHFTNWKGEDLNGWDYTSKQLTLWYSTFMLVLLIKSDFESGLYSVDVLYQRYKIKTLATCLNCLKIPFFEMLNLVGVNLESYGEDGINTLGIEDNMWIEFDKCITSVFPVSKECSKTLNELAENMCTILLTNDCQS